MKLCWTSVLSYYGYRRSTNRRRCRFNRQVRFILNNRWLFGISWKSISVAILVVVVVAFLEPFWGPFDVSVFCALCCPVLCYAVCCVLRFVLGVELSFVTLRCVANVNLPVVFSAPCALLCFALTRLAAAWLCFAAATAGLYRKILYSMFRTAATSMRFCTCCVSV